MAIEYELKFRATGAVLTDLRQAYPGTCQTFRMETTYYDTPAGTLGKLHWTLRRRMENGKSVCTLKTPLPDGSRGEWETECDEILNAIEPLCALGAPKQLALLTAGGVEPVCGAKFTRLAGRIDAMLPYKCGDMEAGAILFSKEYGYLCETKDAAALLRRIKED